MPPAKIVTLTKKFMGSTEAAATEAARRWSRDLSAHDALVIESITSVKKGQDKFFATVTYQQPKG